MGCHPQAKKGFSLIEVMVAGVILTFSSVSIIGLINYANRLQERQGKRTSALKAHDTGIQLRTQVATNEFTWPEFVQFYYKLYNDGSNSVEFAVDSINPAAMAVIANAPNAGADPTQRFTTCSMQTLYDPNVGGLLSSRGATFTAGAGVNGKYKFYLYSIILTPRLLDPNNPAQYDACCTFLASTASQIVNPYLPPVNEWPHYIFPDLFDPSGCAARPNLPSYLANYRILLTSIVFPIGTKAPGGLQKYVVDIIREQTLITAED